MEPTGNVAVVIPFYRTSINPYELIALQQCEKILSGYPRIAIKPQGLTLPHIPAITLTDTISFEDKYFDGIKGYNELMLSDTFYKAFLNYEYILIYQLDAFVFKDELALWCSFNYDYIGAPWLRRKGYANPLKERAYQLMFDMHARFNIKQDGLPTDKQFYNRVGNGGFSLRRVKNFYDLSQKMRPKIASYLSKENYKYNEDAFWSIEVNRIKNRLSIPPYKKAVGFAIELEPERAMALNNQELPFGCHAWDLHLDFWRSAFKERGYDI